MTSRPRNRHNNNVSASPRGAFNATFFFSVMRLDGRVASFRRRWPVQRPAVTRSGVGRRRPPERPSNNRDAVGPPRSRGPLHVGSAPQTKSQLTARLLTSRPQKRFRTPKRTSPVAPAATAPSKRPTPTTYWAFVSIPVPIDFDSLAKATRPTADQRGGGERRLGTSHTCDVLQTTDLPPTADETSAQQTMKRKAPSNNYKQRHLVARFSTNST